MNEHLSKNYLVLKFGQQEQIILSPFGRKISAVLQGQSG